MKKFLSTGIAIYVSEAYIVIMKIELTTSELIQLTGINPRTLTNWTRKGWLPPSKPGRGRGVQNVFDTYSVAWASTLGEVFRLWPDASTRVFLGAWVFVGEKYRPPIIETVLADGTGILRFLRTSIPFRHKGMVVLLAQGTIVGSQDRFAEILIAPYERVQPYLDGWLTSVRPRTIFEATSPDHSDKIVRAVSCFNYQQNLLAVEQAMKRM